MSWLSKVGDLAKGAEELLVRLDNNTGSAIQTQRSNRRSSGNLATGSARDLGAAVEASPSITEQVGRGQPSHAQSDLVRPARRQPTSGHAPSASVLPSHRDAHLISFLNEPGAAEEGDEKKSTFSIHELTEASDLVLVNNLRSQLTSKDSQLSALKTTVTDLEIQLEDERLRSKKERERAEKERVTSAMIPVAAPSGPSTEILLKEKGAIQSELSNLKKRFSSQEEQLSTVNDQLRLAKFNLTENKKEFDEYKEKAQKILQTKERLIESLKAESNGEEESNSAGNGVLLAQIEEIRLERDLARSDLESAQLQIYNVRAEADEVESAAREAKSALSEAKKKLDEERDSWTSNHSILREKAECARSEVEVMRAELERDRSMWQRRLDERDAELTSLREDARRHRNSPGMEDGGRATLMLLQKEEELREVVREKQILSVKLERALRASKDTVLPMGGVGEGSNYVPAGMGTGSLFQGQLVKALTILRGNRTARTYFVGYIAAIHLLLFFIILTYTPESHPEHYSGPSPGRG